MSDPKKPEPRRPNEKEDYGYGYYPSRSNYDQEEQSPPSLMKRLDEGRRAIKDLQCASNVLNCIEKNKLVKVLISALKKNGCNFDPKRHVSCENCISKVNGGYDFNNNQVVVCKNNSSSADVCCNVLTHELIHMYDACRAKADFTNLEHLACTEIRAAAILHCRFLTAMSEGDVSFVNFRNKHQDCTKRKAIMSVLMVRNVTMEEASAVVNKVFKRCYNDLEPFGRIPRARSSDPEKIQVEGYMYGYGT